MSRRTVVVVSDDLGGKGPAQPVQFSFEGLNYTIDLTKRNRDTLMRKLQPYINAAQPVPPGHAAGLRVPGDRAKHAATIRQWAKTNQVELKSRGRIPARVVDMYIQSKEDENGN